MDLHWIIKFLLWITWLEQNFCIGESAIILKRDFQRTQQI